MEILRRYLGGFWHLDKGLGIKRELLDNTEEWFRVNQVRFELIDHGETRLAMKEEIEAVFEDIEKGKKGAEDYELVKTYCLAGQKVRIQDSAALIREIARGRIKWATEDYWGYEVPTEVPGLDLHRFDEHRYYHDGEIKKLKDQLKEERLEWLHSFDDLDPKIRNIFG
jgi:hypothetical protein